MSEGKLGSQSGSDRFRCGGEGGAEGISDGLEDVAVVSLYGFA